MDLRQITYFMTVYEERSLTKAAPKAKVVQSALSMQIRRLEEELGLRLFERTPRGLEPTALCRHFYELLVPIAQDISAARQRILEMASADQVSGSIRCGFPPTFFKAVLGRVIPAYAERHPNVDLTVLESYGGTLRDWVMGGEIDFAFGGWSNDDAGLAYDCVYEEQLVLVSGRPIAGPSLTECELGKIDGLRLFLPTTRQLLGPVLRDNIARGLIRPRQTIVMDSYLGVLEAARASDWAAIIPISGILDEVQSPDLFIYPLRKPSIAFEWHLLHERRKPLSLAARMFVDLVVTELAATDARWQRIRSRNRRQSQGAADVPARRTLRSAQRRAAE